MMASRSRRFALVLGLALLLCAVPAQSDEVKGQWRIELHVGGYDAGDSLESDRDNVQVIQPESGQAPSPLTDRRPPIASEGRLDTNSFQELRVSYGLHSWKNGEIVIDTGIGYLESTIDNVEFAYLLDKQQSPFLQSAFLQAGDLKTVPISVGIYARYSPTKRFNPFFGVNLGYMFNEFRESSEWKELADQLDASLVGYVERTPGGSIGDRQLATRADAAEFFVPAAEVSGRVDDLYTLRTNRDLDNDGTEDCTGAGLSRVVRDRFGNERVEPIPCFSIFGHDVRRPRVDTPNTFYFELRGGADWQWRPKIALFGEIRFSWAAKNMRVTVDDQELFGKGVGDGTFTLETAPAPSGGRPAYISSGGIVANAGGVTGPQTGQYWLTGGTLDYGGFTFSAGLRFTL